MFTALPFTPVCVNKMCKHDAPNADLWTGNYSDVASLSCQWSSDLLFDWSVIKRALISWLKDMVHGSERTMQTYWEMMALINISLGN